MHIIIRYLHDVLGCSYGTAATTTARSALAHTERIMPCQAMPYNIQCKWWKTNNLSNKWTIYNRKNVARFMYCFEWHKQSCDNQNDHVQYSTFQIIQYFGFKSQSVLPSSLLSLSLLLLLDIKLTAFHQIVTLHRRKHTNKNRMIFFLPNFVSFSYIKILREFNIL